MKVLKALTLFIVAFGVAGAGIGAIAWQPAISAVTPPDASTFDASLVRRGSQVAVIGNCNTCHTVQGGRSFAGGVALSTPFGVIYSTNITPEPESGIGRWSELAFRRALREGVDRDGRHLYPAFPYDHFTLVTDADIQALYAFFMTREAVYSKAPPNEIPFPLNLRPLIAGWKLLFFYAGTYRADPAQSDTWNRGAYLVEGLAHCGSCHTPRNAFGAEKSRRRFAGGEVEGWTAYALDRTSPAPIQWDAEAMHIYLRNGWHDRHGIARGPMAAVVDNLASAKPEDLQAISVYLMGTVAEQNARRRNPKQAPIERARVPKSAETQTVGYGGTSPSPQDSGEKIYQATCASCHDADESNPAGPFSGIDLHLSTGPSGPNARNVLNVVLWGLPPAEGARSPFMPGFIDVLTEKQLVSLLVYIRSRFSNRPAWKGIEMDVRDTLDGRRSVMIYPSPRTDPAQPVSSYERR